MRRALAAAAVALGCLTIAGCASAPDHGVIHAKDYTPSYMSLMPCGKACLMPIYHQATWEFDLYASKDDHGWVYVDETTFHKYSVGDEFAAAR